MLPAWGNATVAQRCSPKAWFLSDVDSECGGNVTMTLTTLANPRVYPSPPPCAVMRELVSLVCSTSSCSNLKRKNLPRGGEAPARWRTAGHDPPEGKKLRNFCCSTDLHRPPEPVRGRDGSRGYCCCPDSRRKKFTAGGPGSGGDARPSLRTAIVRITPRQSCPTSAQQSPDYRCCL